MAGQSRGVLTLVPVQSIPQIPVRSHASLLPSGLTFNSGDDPREKRVDVEKQDSPAAIEPTTKVIIQDAASQNKNCPFEAEICLVMRGNSRVGSSMKVKLKLPIFLIL